MAKKEKPYSGRSGAAARASGRSLAIDKPSIQARKSAAQSMQRAGVQSLSGLSGSQGQVARFKAEQNNLRNEYNNKNTSDDRKEEIVKDLRGVSRNLNDQSRAAALNQVIREFGPGSVTNTGGIMGSDAGARFEQLRGNPNFYQDGRPGLETFVGNQGAFKTGDKNLFKQVHPNPLKILLGAATQAGNISPLGLVRNINKIRTGEPLIDLSFMDRNKSESPSRMKDFYSAYMKEMNKKIADAKSSKNAEQFDAVDMDPGFRKFMPTQLETEDMTLDRTMFLPDDQTNRYGTPAGAEPGEEDMIDDEEFTNLLNQYSLLNQDDLADALLDDSEIEKQLTDVEKMSQEEYDKELEETLRGIPGGDIYKSDDKDYQDVPYRTDGIPVEAFKGALLPGDPRDPAPYGFEYKLPEATSFGGRSMDPNFDSYPYTIPVEPVTISDLEDDKSLPFDVTELSQKQLDFLNSPKTQDDLKRGTLSPRQVFDKLPFYEEKTPFNIFKGDQEPTTPQEFNEYLDAIDENKYLRRIATVADGGSVNNTYNTLKLINDTMNQGV